MTVPAAAAPTDDRVPDEVARQLADGGKARFWVRLDRSASLDRAAAVDGRTARGAAVVDELRHTAEREQAPVLDTVREHGGKARPFWIANAVEVTGDRATVDALLAEDAVAEILPATTISVPETTMTETAAAEVEWNVEAVRAPEVWEKYGTHGEGVVIASLDTGVDLDHPALRSSYRGSRDDGSVSHDYNFYDPTGVCPDAAPCDDHGHGTHTTGTMVGSALDGPRVGVAPGAQWIAVKGCSLGNCWDADLLAAAQWLLAPTDTDGENPRPDLRPDIVNNSWGGAPWPPFYEDAVRAWVAAGIMPVFSAGNDGPSCRTSSMPGALPDAYSVGAVDRDNEAAWFSSRGPAEGTEETKPNISAPGVEIASSVPGGGYALSDGTSMAAPHVAGAVALLWSASTSLRRNIVATRDLLDATAVDRADTSCGGTDADNGVYGEGTLDTLALLEAADLGESGQVAGRITSTEPLLGGARVRFTGPVDRTAAADADGAYRIRLPAGEYEVSVRAFGHRTATGGSVTVVTDETARLDLNLSALPRHTVRGTVRDGAGTPLPLSTVSIPGTPLAPVTAGSDGTFAIDAVPVGEWPITAEYSKCATPYEGTVVAGDGSTADIRLALRSDGYGYSCNLTGWEWVGGVDEVPNSHEEVRLPFAFSFYGRTYDSLRVSESWGYLSFTHHVASSSAHYRVPEPPGEVCQPLVCKDTVIQVFAQKSTLYEAQAARTAVVGTAPNRTFAIEWLMRAPSGNEVAAQVLLHEDGRIGLQYRGIAPWDHAANGSQIAVGMESEDALHGFQFSYDEPVLAHGLAVELDPGPRDFVVGTVTDAEDGSPVPGARVSFPLPESDGTGRVYTDADGSYEISLPKGEWELTYEGAGYGTVTRAVVASGGLGTQRVDAALRSGHVVADRDEVAVEIRQGGHDVAHVDLENAGGLPVGVRALESGTHNEPAPDRLYSWPDHRVLLYTGQPEHATGNAKQALEALGLDYAEVSVAPNAMRMAIVHDYDLVIFDGPAQDYSHNANLLAEYVRAGGRVIYQVQGPQDSGIPIWDALGVEMADYNFPPDASPVHWWDGGHGLFTHLEQVPPMDWRGDNGFYDLQFRALDGEAVAGYSGSPTDAKAAIVIGNEGRTIAKGFVDGKVRHDTDGDGKADEVELWTNMIDGVLNGYHRDVPWLDADLNTDALAPGGHGTLSVAVDARDMSVGEHTAYVAVRTGSGTTPYVEIPVRVTVTEGPATVTIRDIDTGVPNREIADGRTIDEAIADEAHWKNRGELVRHVTEATRDMVQRGELSRQERSRLIRAAAQSQR